MTRVTLLAIAVLAAQWPAPEQQRLLQPPPIVSHNVTVLREWVSAVRQHEPGEDDHALQSVAAWTAEDVKAAWIDVQVLLAIIKAPRATAFDLQPSGERRVFRTFITRADLEAMRQLANEVRPGVEDFVKRAAVLHSDLARVYEINREPLDAPSMLAPRRFVLETDDGQQKGLHGSVVHWEFGQILLASVPDAPRDDFVRSWYRASLALKLAVEELDSMHFTRALEIFPNDSVIRFLNGSLHEAFAHAAVQKVVEAARLPKGLQLDVRPEGSELRLAETEYRRAIELDPAFGEARLRRGRVLARQGKPTDAVAELRQALALVREPMLEYYARLFLGAEEEALGRMKDARVLYEQAAALYPHAQAPRLALSQLAHRSGNRAAARELLGAMREHSSQIGLDDDPWWMYQRAPGRTADEWREATYRLLPR